jgi:protein-disulfide isomerase
VSTLKPPVGEADHSSGPEDAPVTLVEYGDYECPHCGRAFPIVHEVRRRMGKKLRFVFRNFPLKEAHAHAEHAAEAAEAAAGQGRFWEMHESLFKDQEALEDEDLLARARVLGLDVARFENELADGVHEKRVRGDFRSGVRSGVNGTPTFFINGVRYEDSWDLDSLLAAVQDAAR